MRLAYLFQCFLILIWWVFIISSREFYSFFEFNGISKNVFHCFLIPDFLLISLLSLILSYKNIPSLKYAILGAFAYAAIFCVSATISLGGGEISSTLMVLGVMFNVLLCYKNNVFRSSSSSSNALNLIKTSIQISMIWSIFLFIVPSFLLNAENIDISKSINQSHQICAITFFAFFSIIGLWSGYSLSKHGKGTPLPTDATTKLVIRGTYAYVRNPMAICGIGQCLAISLYTFSISILIYSILAILIWNFVVRKFEEDDMESKFGEAYLKYKIAVKCWIPLIKKYQ